MSENTSKAVVKWHEVPAVIDTETIARELGWPVERFKAYQESKRRELFEKVPDFANVLRPDELILRWIPLDYWRTGEQVSWSIVLTDKRILYRYWKREVGYFGKVSTKAMSFCDHYYSNIVEVKPQWQGDLGSHVEGGGGYVGGWIWGGWGGVYGTQEPTKTIQHHMDCVVSVKERNGSQAKFPFLNIQNQNSLNIAEDFIGMLNKLVDLAWKKGTPSNIDEGDELAIANCNKALEINPKDAAAYSNRGVAYYKRGEYDLAIADFNKSLKLVPWKNVTAYLFRGAAFLNKENYKWAISDFGNAIKSDRKNAVAYRWRGVAYYRKGEHGKALADFNKAIELSGDPVFIQGIKEEFKDLYKTD
jgi:tetratricopeptide (TPR) repeat protein